MDVDCFTGKIFTRVYEHYPDNFTFEFSEFKLAVECMWRIKVDGRVVLASRDHGQQFGLLTQVDAYSEAKSHLQQCCIVVARLDEASADLTLEVENGRRLEIITDSSGYEPWSLMGPGIHMIALGGGGISDLSSKD